MEHEPESARKQLRMYEVMHLNSSDLFVTLYYTVCEDDWTQGSTKAENCHI